MIHFFLKRKHWQIFLLLLGLPLLFQGYILYSLFVNPTPETGFKIENISPLFGWLPIIMIVTTTLLFCWLWSLAMGLQKYIPKEISLKTRTFKWCFFFPFLYILFLMFYMSGLFNGLKNNGLVFGDWFIILIYLMHIFSIFCIIYVFYFVAKTLKIAEVKQKVRFKDFAVEFFLLSFYILGIWIIQPRVNKLVKD